MNDMPHFGPSPAICLSDLDFSDIRFPSDELSVRRLRELHPDLFDFGYHSGAQAQPVYLLRPEEPGHVTECLGNLLFLERYVVAGGYAATTGLARPEGEEDALQEELAGLYNRYGLASSPQHATQMIRNLEQSGRQLGVAHSP